MDNNIHSESRVMLVQRAWLPKKLIADITRILIFVLFIFPHRKDFEDLHKPWKQPTLDFKVTEHSWQKMRWRRLKGLKFLYAPFYFNGKQYHRDSPVPSLHRPLDRFQKWRETLRFLPQVEIRLSSIAPNPVRPERPLPTPQYPWLLRRTRRTSLRSRAQV